MLTSLTWSSCVLVLAGRTGAGPLAFRGSLIGGGAIGALPPPSAGAVVANPNPIQIAGDAVRATMTPSQRFYETALRVPAPVPARVIQVE